MMLHRLGFFGLVIASALWAQGCAQTQAQPIHTPLSEVHQEIQGTWKCHSETVLTKDVIGYLDSTFIITPNEMLEKAIIKVEDKTDNPGFGIFEGESIDIYKLINNNTYTWVPSKYELRYKAASPNAAGVAISMMMGMNARNAKKDKQEQTTQFTLSNGVMLQQNVSEPMQSPKKCVYIDKQYD